MAVRVGGSRRRFESAVRVGGSDRRFGSAVRIGGSDRWFGSVVRIGGSDRWFGSVVRIGGSSRPLLSRGRADASCRRSALTIPAGKPSRGREPAIQTRETPCVRAAFRPCSPRAHVARTRLEASPPRRHAAPPAAGRIRPVPAESRLRAAPSTAVRLTFRRSPASTRQTRMRAACGALRYPDDRREPRPPRHGAKQRDSRTKPATLAPRRVAGTAAPPVPRHPRDTRGRRTRNLSRLRLSL
ncbi:hypothetical protein BIM11_5940 [Burkholderia pseudomallei]|nr:hypothetical protein BIM11_5940 [Burkholderia pseudomallei]